MTTARPQWDYFTAMLTDIPRAAQSLQNMGTDGWEVVNVLPWAVGGSAITGEMAVPALLVVCKRPRLPDQAKSEGR